MTKGTGRAFICLLALLWVANIRLCAQGRANYADWKLEWADEFNVPTDTVALAARWRFSYPWGLATEGTQDNGCFSAQELEVVNGTLNMTIRRQPTARLYRGLPRQYTAPMLFSRHTADSLRPRNCDPAAEGFSYGLFEVRVRLAKSATTPQGFWLFGGAPDELDVFEANADVITNNIHLVPGNYWRPSRRQDSYCQCFFYNTDPAGNLHQQFHTYGVSWLPNDLVFYFDGVPIRHETRLVPTGCAMSLILNLQALTWSDQAVDTMQVDYIRVYRPRRLPPLPLTFRPGSDQPQSESAWIPDETQPGLLDQGTWQTWRLALSLRTSPRLDLQLTENYNPPCVLPLPLPLAGQWAPTWAQTNGTPELRVQIVSPDSVHWSVFDRYGRTVARGTTAGSTEWRPRWNELLPGTYALQLRQGATARVQPLTIVQRPLDSAPSAEWLLPAPPPGEPELPEPAVTDPVPAETH